MNTSSPVSSEKQGGTQSRDTKANVSQGYGKVALLPLIIGLLILGIGGGALLNRADAQARDTVRKHHLQDLEDALFFARDISGTYPPYDQSTWCGNLDTHDAIAVRAQIEQVLRRQNDLYSNEAKPFPQDPDPVQISNRQGYFYWKHSPASFELMAQLEADPQEPRSTTACPTTTPSSNYNYSLTSVWREDS